MIQAGPLPPGWSGKLWAISEGLKHAAVAAAGLSAFHRRRYRSRAKCHRRIGRARRNIQSRSCFFDGEAAMPLVRRNLADPGIRLFLFHALSAQPGWRGAKSRTAAAAGGCILIRPSALDRIGGIESIRGEIIDDCALARAVKRTGGGIWLGVDQRYSQHSRLHDFRGNPRHDFANRVRAASSLGSVADRDYSRDGHHLSRSAAVALHATSARRCFRTGRLDLDDASRTHQRCASTAAPLLWAPLLPLVALFYISATIDSAIAYWTGRGGFWKGRIQDER